MGFFDNLFRKAPKEAPFRLTYTGNALVMLPGNTQVLYREGWLNNSTVYSIVTKIAAKMATIPIYTYKTTNEKALAEYKALTRLYDPKALADAKRLARKEFDEITTPNDPINRLLKQPNPGMSYAQFTEFALINQMIYGGCPIYANKGLTGQQVLSLYPFNPQMIIIEPDDTLTRIEKARLLMSQQQAEMNPDQLYMLRYTNPELSLDGSHLFGYSPLRSGLLEVQKDNENTKVQLFMFQHKGVTGFFRPDGIDAAKAIQASPGGPDAVRNSLDDLLNRRNGGNMRPFTPLPLVYNTFGMDAEQLELIESAIASKEKIAQIYDFPKPLVSNDQSAFNNVKQSEKYLLTNTCSGHIQRVQEFWNWVCQISGYTDRAVMLDISSQPELQEDFQMLAEWMAKSGLYTTNEAREVTKYEALDIDSANVPLVSAGLVRLDELGMDEIGEENTL
jgi:HK97 family phage portal protein